MPAFFSPLANPSAWTLTIAEGVTIPSGLRYAGYSFRGIAATHAPAESIFVPALSVFRKVVASAKTFVEVQVNPFPIRLIASAFPWGVPTFYFVFDDASGLTTFNDDETAIGNELLGSVGSVTIICAGQDRVVLDPALWASQITDAINATGANSTEWQPFAAAVASQLNTGPNAPVLLLDHAGQPRTGGSVDIILPTSSPVRATLDPADHGDLQKTVARLHAADPVAMPISNLWSTASTMTLRPVPPGAPSPSTSAFDSFQILRLEDRATAAGEITITPALRHASFTDVNDWFAEQFTTPSVPANSQLQRFTRNNFVTPFINGKPFLDNLFRTLNAARAVDCGFHHAGWDMFPEERFTKRTPNDPSDLPRTLREAAQAIGSAGGGCRFLPAQFIQIEPSTSVGGAESFAFFFITAGILVLDDLGVSFARTDGSGAVVLLLIWIGSTVFVDYVIDSGGRPLEPNKSAVDVLGAGDIQNSRIHLAPNPVSVEDNPIAPLLGDFPFNAIFDIIRHFGVYHQKFSVVKTGPSSFVGYCGGIDLNPNRLDDADHLLKMPFHDIHARIEGPAVHDLALTYEQRWQRDGGGDLLAFQTPDIAVLGSPGTDIVQVARTYFSSNDASRQLAFAPAGDRTIADTMLKAIADAREFIYIEDQYFTPPQAYRTALLNKVTNGEIRKLIVTLPNVTDQPFGEIVRSAFITDLITADAGGGIVQIGYPRRHVTVPDNDLRSSSGKLILGEDMTTAPTNQTIVLGPESRVPLPPFWVAVDGELMWVFDESTLSAPEHTKRFEADRGADTRLIKGGGSPAGARVRAHKKDTAVTVVEVAGIYVHAKMMIIDDVFLGLGSANLNRRGLFHDGEINIFTMPQSLKAYKNNPIAALRCKLWAEMLNLPADMAAPLLEDPIAAAALFSRSPLAGNRYVDIQATPFHVVLGASTGDGIVGNILGLLGFTLIAANNVKLFDGVVDPTTTLE